MKTRIRESEIKKLTKKLIHEIKTEPPDIIVGLSRGGLVPAQYLAYGLNILDIETISVQLRDNPNNNDLLELDSIMEINNCITKIKKKFPNKDYINILIVDDLIDSGKTMELIDFYFQQKKLSITTAVLYQNKEANIQATYFGEYKPDGWIEFPWDY